MSAFSVGVDSASATILVVGSVNVDTVLRVQHLPVPGETITATSTMERHGGKGANQAVFSAALLAGVAMVGCVGDDDLGARALASLEHAGVDHSRILARRAATGTATVVVDDAGENTIVRVPGANALITPEEVTSAVMSLASTSTVVLISLEIPLAAAEAAARAAARIGARVVLNPAPARRLPESMLKHCYLVVPNGVEMTQVTELGSPGAILAAGAGALVVTHGAAGAEIIRADEPSVAVPSPRVRAVDTTGAGDAFVAALSVAVHDGLDLSAAVEMAVRAGAIAVTRPGARGALPTRARIAELSAGLAQHRPR